MLLLAYIVLMLIGVCISKGKMELDYQDLFGTMMSFPCSAHEDPDHGRLSFNTETFLYVVSPYDYYYYVKTLTTYFRHLEFKIGFDLFLNLDLAKFLCIITTYHIIKLL